MEQVAVIPAAASERAAARPSAAAVGWYAAGSVGTGAYGTVPGLVLLYFLTNVLGVAPVLAGAALVVPKLVDVVLHPLVGLLADRGHERRLVTAGAVALPLLFVGLFAVPASLTGAAAALYVAALLIAANLAFSLFQVPYVAAPASATDDTHERTRIVGWRMGALIGGIVVSGALATALADPASGARADYRTMAVVVAAILAAALLGGRRGMARMRRRRETVAHPPLRTSMRAVWADRPFRGLLVAFLLMSTATHILLAGTPYYASYVLGAGERTAGLFLTLIVPAIAAMPLWTLLARRIGKERCLQWALALFALGAVLLAAGDEDRRALALVTTALIGVALAAVLLLPYAMLADATRTAGGDAQQREGAYTGAWTATDTLGAALGPWLYAGALAIAGFAASDDGSVVPQSASAVDGVRLAYSLLPAVVAGGAALLHRRALNRRTGSFAPGSR